MKKMKTKNIERNLIGNIILLDYFNRIERHGAKCLFRLTDVRNRNSRQVPNKLFWNILLTHLNQTNYN